MGRLIALGGLVIGGLVMASGVTLAQDQESQAARRFARFLEPKKITVDGLERTYRVFVPNRGGEPMPLVLVLHGGGFGERGALHVIGYTGMIPLAGRERFIVVYPVGIDGNWNDGRGVDFIRAQKEDIDDVKFIRRVVDAVAESHPVDRSRIFSTGISNGAFMSHRLAAEASDMVAAIAPVVGGMSPRIAEGFSPQYPVSLFAITGNADPLVPYDGGEVGLKFAKKRGHTISASAIVSRYVKRNGIRGEPTISMLEDADPNDGTVTEATVYPNGEEGSRVQVYVVKHGGHTWPGERSYLTERLVGRTSRDFDASEAIWNFFESCPPRRP